MSKYALVENGSITRLTDFLPRNYKNVSRFDLLDGQKQKEYGWHTVTYVPCSYNIETQFVESKRYYIENGQVFSTDVILDKPIHIEQPQSLPSQEELQQAFNLARENFFVALRNERNERLRSSDWTQVADLQETKTSDWKLAWKNYRQALRDLPEQYISSDIINISDVIWPDISQEG